MPLAPSPHLAAIGITIALIGWSSQVLTGQPGCRGQVRIRCAIAVALT
jgi:hypothetical protein